MDNQENHGDRMNDPLTFSDTLADEADELEQFCRYVPDSPSQYLAIIFRSEDGRIGVLRVRGQLQIEGSNTVEPVYAPTTLAMLGIEQSYAVLANPTKVSLDAHLA